jgi:hypothetical protein
MNLAVIETYDADALDNLLLSPYQLGSEIFSQDEWISCIVNTSKRPDNYIKQIEKLEAIKKSLKWKIQSSYWHTGIFIEKYG